MKILVIEDNLKIRDNIIKFFNLSGFLAEGVRDWKEALEKIRYNDYNVLILDINMPVMNWKEFLKELKKLWNKTPAIALTSNSLLEDKLEMFELWVEDYLTKPFELKELKARVYNIWKRNYDKIEDNIIKIKSLDKKNKENLIHINLSKHIIKLNNENIKIWNKEFLIIEFLLRHKWYPQSKVKILENVWGEFEENLELSSTTLEAHISIIRKKLWKSFIQTIKWTWYLI